MAFTIYLAKTAGFCMGVRRAVETAEQAAQTAPRPVRTWGELIHNHAVGERLAAQGVRPAECSDPAELAPGGTIVIRAHGVPPATERALRTAGRTVLDATCPLVKKNQQLIEEAAAAGRYVIIAGDADHAETVGLLARAVAPSAGRENMSPPGGTVVTTTGDAEKLSAPAGAFLLAQTTFSREVFAQIREILTRKIPGLTVRDTICAATAARQAEIASLAEKCDCVVIVGGAHSANTRRLAETAAGRGKPAFLVENAAELRPADFATAQTVAVSAGASTPDWQISAVLARLKEWGVESA